MRTDDPIDAHLVRYDVSFSTRALTFLYRIARVQKKDRGEKMGKEEEGKGLFSLARGSRQAARPRGDQR